jgi:hypothetical protein
MNDETWRRVDRSTIQQLYATFISDSIAPSCVRAIENRLLSSGILFTSRDYSIVASESFQSHVNLHFGNFVQAALKQLIICGFCFFVVEDSIPRVIPLGMADVRWRPNRTKYTIELAVFKAGEEVIDENVFKIVDCSVDINGNVVSTISLYLRTRSLFDAFMRNSLTADALNARPPIYTTSDTNSVFDERDIANQGEVEGVRASLIGADMKVRTKLAVTSHQFNEMLVRQMNARQSDSVRSERRDQMSGVSHFDADMEDIPQPVYPLPLDARVAQAPRPVARADIVSIMKHFENLACIALGVNSETIGADIRSGGHLGANTLERVNVVTLETTLRWARVLEPALVQIYKLVWGDNDEDNENITVVFPSTMPSALVERLFVSKVLAYNSYVNYISNIIQMPSSAFETVDHRFDAPQPGQAAPKPGELGNNRMTS